MPSPAPDWATRAEQYTGNYRLLRRSHTTFEKLLGVLSQARVTLGDPGEIVVPFPMIGVLRFVEIEPGLFENSDGLLRLGFTDDPDTGHRYVQNSFMPVVEAKRVGAAASPAFQLLLLLIWLIAFVSIIVLMPVRYFMQLRFEEVKPLRGLARWLRWAALAVAVAGLAFLVILMSSTNQESFLYGDARGAIMLALGLVMLAILPGAVVLGGVVLTFMRDLWGWPGRVYYLLFALAMMVFFAQLHYLNLIGFRM